MSTRVPMLSRVLLIVSVVIALIMSEHLLALCRCAWMSAPSVLEEEPEVREGAWEHLRGVEDAAEHFQECHPRPVKDAFTRYRSSAVGLRVQI